jgi:hypothetical protein
MFRDGLMQGLVKGQMDLDLQAYRPAIVYINGDYWGIHNLREKINESYLQNNYDYGKDQIDLLERDRVVLAGDVTHYNRMYSFLNRNDMSKPENYTYVKTLMDMDEFINYQIAQIYFSNTDWPGNNIKFWRPKTENGRWRWIVFDTDFGFNLKEGGLSHNTIEFAAATNGPSWPNPPWSTFLFRTLLKSEEFRNTFIQRFASCMNSTFSPERVLNLIEQYKSAIAPEMPGHIARWKYPSSMNAWNTEIGKMISFGRYRLRALERHLVGKFSLKALVDCSLVVAEEGMGWIYVEDVPQTDNYLPARFYPEMPIHAKACPKPGYRFVGWEGLSNAAIDSITTFVADESHLIAYFEEGNSIVINEIHYHPDALQNAEGGEFIELFNAGNAIVDLSGYSFTKGISFTFPERTWIFPREYLLLTQNPNHYTDLEINVFEWKDGRLDNAGEEIRLVDRFGQLVNAVAYERFDPWPTLAAGYGYSLSLSDPTLDNDDPQNWRASQHRGGTPGQTNFHEFPSTEIRNWNQY